MSEELKFLSINEITALLKATKDSRDYAVITLFLTTGIFLNELQNLQLTDVDWDNKLLHVKGNRQRDLPLNTQAFEALARWSQQRVETPETALFLTNKGTVKELSTRSIDHLLRKYGQKAGIQQPVNVHLLRNTYAVRLFAEGATAKEGAKLLGITDFESIHRYVSAADQDPIDSQLLTPSTARKLTTSGHTTIPDTRGPVSQLLSKILPTKPKVSTTAQPHLRQGFDGQASENQESSLKTTIRTNPEEVIFGRDTPIREIRSLLHKEQSVLLTGQLGIGKTHLAKYLSRVETASRKKQSSAELIYLTRVSANE